MLRAARVMKLRRPDELNDDFRRTFVGGLVMITAGVEAMPDEQRRSLLAKVRAFDAFTEDNDPHGEHDFGAVDEGGVRCFWRRTASSETQWGGLRVALFISRARHGSRPRPL
jgi:hypothetical protein